MIARHDTTGGGGADRSVDNVVWQRSQCVVLAGRRGVHMQCWREGGRRVAERSRGVIGEYRVQQRWASQQLVGEVQVWQYEEQLSGSSMTGDSLGW